MSTDMVIYTPFHKGRKAQTLKDGRVREAVPDEPASIAGPISQIDQFLAANTVWMYASSIEDLQVVYACVWDVEDGVPDSPDEAARRAQFSGWGPNKAASRRDLMVKIIESDAGLLAPIRKASDAYRKVQREQERQAKIIAAVQEAHEHEMQASQTVA